MKQNISHCIIGKSTCRLVLMLVMLFSVFDNAAYADDVTISTNDSGYYELGTAAQLQKFAQAVNAGASDIKGVLTADIDVSTLGTEYWTPIGLYDESTGVHAFSGKFDGQGHTISGIVLRKSAASGLFGYASGATIRNVIVSGAQMKTTSDTRVASIQDAIAPVCGLAIGGTVISGCRSTMTEILYKVRNEDEQKDINYVGGIVGEMRQSTVTGCRVDGFVRTDGHCVGGIAGLCYLSQIDDCHLEDYNGGHSAVVGTDSVGGICGMQHGRSLDVAIRNCTVADGSIVKATASSADTICGISKLVTDQSLFDTSNGVYEIYTPDHLKWFSAVVNGGKTTAKARLMNDINMSKAGEFTPIGDLEGLQFAGEFDGQGYTIDSLTIKNQRYSGLFCVIRNGIVKNFTLNHAYLPTTNDYIGLVAGKLAQDEGKVAYIENVIVKNGRLTRSMNNVEPRYIGGVVGQVAEGAEVRDCSFHGEVASHEDYVGGICGYLESGSKLYRCTTIGPTTIAADDYVGGVVGYMTGDATLIDNCSCDETAGTVTVNVSEGNNSGDIYGYNNSGGVDHTKYNEGGLQYEFTGNKITVNGKEASEMRIVGTADSSKSSHVAIVDIGSSANYFTTEIKSVPGVKELSFCDNNSNLAGTEACGWISMKIDDGAFDSNFKALWLKYRVYAGDDHDVMLRPGDVVPADTGMLKNCPDAKIYVEKEYYSSFLADPKWAHYKNNIVPVTSMRTEDVNALYGARYAFDRNFDTTASVKKVGNVTQMHVIGIDESYVTAENDSTVWIYQDIGETYDYNTTKIWGAAFKDSKCLKQVKFQEITKSASRASQAFNIEIGDAAFANCPNLKAFNVVLYSDEGKDHVEYLHPSQLPIGENVFDNSPNVKIYVPRDLVDEFKADVTYGWANYKDLIYEGDFGNADWTEQGVVYSYYTSEDGQTRYTNDYNTEMEKLLSTWNASYRNFSPSRILEYGNSSTIKYVFASGIVPADIADNKGKLLLYSDIAESYPNHYKTLAISGNAFQNQTCIKEITFTDIKANNYNTVTDFAMAIPSKAFMGCSNLKELSMFMYVTKGTNHYVGIKPSQVFIGDSVFVGVDEDFRIQVLPEYYNDFINDANWGKYKDYIVAADYLPVDAKPVTRDGVTYDYATSVMNDMTSKQITALKSSYWNILVVTLEAAAMATTGFVAAAPAIIKDGAIPYFIRHIAENFAYYRVFELNSIGQAVISAGVALGAGIVIGNAIIDSDVPVNYVINRAKKNFERSSSYAMQGQWVMTEKITNVPHMYVKSVEDQETVTLFNDPGTNNDDYQTVAIANDAFHNKTKLKELKFQERYGEGSRSLASGWTLALPAGMFKGCTNFTTLNLVNYSTGAHSSNHCYKGLTPDNFVPMGDIFADLDETTLKNIKIKVGKEELQEFLDDDYWSKYKDMFETVETPIVEKQTEWSSKYALAYDKNTLPLRTTVSSHDIDHVMIYGADNDELDKNNGLAALINDFGEWNNYKLDYVKAGAFKGNDKLVTLDITDTHTNVADVYTSFDVVLQDSAFAHCKNFTDLNLLYQVTDGSNKTVAMTPSQFTLGKGVFTDTPKLRIKFCLDQEDAFLADTSWVKYKDQFTPCFFEPVDEDVRNLLLSPYRFLTKLNDGTNFNHVDATRAKPEELKTLFKNDAGMETFDEFRAFGCCGLKTIYDHMFSGCTALQSIQLPESITSIEEYAFKDCSLLSTLTIPEKVDTIADCAFYGSGIKEFIVKGTKPAAVDDELFTFGGLDNSYIIYVPDNAVDTYKKEWMGVAEHINGLSQRKGLKVITLTEAGTLAEKLGLTYSYTDELLYDNDLRGNYAQYDSIRIIGPIDGRDIGVLRFMGGRDVDNSNQTAGHLKYLDLYEAELKKSDYTYIRGDYESSWYQLSPFKNKYISEDNCVDEYMFYGMNTLETLILPKTATSLERYALRGCTNLKYLVVGDDMKEIDDYVAGETDNKVLLTMLSKKAPSVSYSSFMQRLAMTTQGYLPASSDEERFNLIIVPNGSVADYTGKSGFSAASDSIINNFEDEQLAEALKKQHIFNVYDLMNGNDITGWVNGNENIKSFNELYASGVTTLKNGSLNGMTNLQDVTLPYGLKKIADDTFTGCSSLHTVYAFGNEIPELEENALDPLPTDFVVYVAEGTEEAYRTAWPKYKDHIQGYRNTRSKVREIVLTEPNTLADSLKATVTMSGDKVVAVGGDFAKLKSLKISGPIGGKDIAVIRFMAGREPDNNQHVYTTCLSYLDLYDAELKADNYYFKLSGVNKRITDDNVVPEDMLWNCDNLETVILPRTATKLNDEALYDMASLKTLVVGDDTNDICNDALGDNKKLTDIIFLCSKKPELNHDAFTDPSEGANRKVNMYVRPGLVNDYSADRQFQNHANKIASTFDNVEQFRVFGSKALATDDDLASVSDVEGWFDNFSALAKLTKLNKTKITELSKNTLAGATALEQVTFPATLTKVEDRAFEKNTNLHWADLTECTSLESMDVSKLGANGDALVYLPESFGEQTAANVVYTADGKLQCAQYNMADRNYDVPKAFTAKAVTFEREFTDSISTLTLPFSCDVPEGFRAYELETGDVTNYNEARFQEVKTMEAFKPYVMKVASDAAVFNYDSETTVQTTPATMTKLTGYGYAALGTLNTISAADAREQKMLVMDNKAIWNYLAADATDDILPFTVYMQVTNPEAKTQDVPSIFDNLTLTEITLDEASDNSTVISSHNGERVNASLKRTLVAGAWNTFCVPFLTYVKGSPLEGCAVSGVKEINGNVISYRTVDVLLPGKPYLVRPTENIVNPTFKGVKINSQKYEYNGAYDFLGTYSPMTIDDTKTTYFLGSDGRLKLAMAKSSMKGMRAYFKVPSGSSAKLSIIIDNEEVIDAIEDVEADDSTDSNAVYSVNGIYMGDDINSLPSGVYIVNGKKIIK